MKKILITVLLLSGCSAFEVKYEERLVCVGFTTPWANDTQYDDESIYWYINQTGWHGVTYKFRPICDKEIRGDKRYK